MRKRCTNPPVPARIQHNVVAVALSTQAPVQQLTTAEIISDAPLSKLAWFIRQLTTSTTQESLDKTLDAVAPVRDTAAAVRDELVLERGEVVPLTHATYGHIHGLYGSGLPIRFSHSRTDLSQPAPQLGEQTRDVLSGMLGYDPERVDRLHADGVV